MGAPQRVTGRLDVTPHDLQFAVATRPEDIRLTGSSVQSAMATLSFEHFVAGGEFEFIENYLLKL